MPWHTICNHTSDANTSKRAVVQRSRSIGPVYQSAHPPAPSLSSQKHFFQVTACGRYLPAVKHSICLWHYEYMLTLKYRHRWTRRYLFFPLLVNCSVLDSNMLCNCDTFGPAIIHYITHDFMLPVVSKECFVFFIFFTLVNLLIKLEVKRTS